MDDKNVRRRFRASNYQSTTRVKPFICTMPMRLDDGWNQIQFNLSDFTRRAYGTNYIETLRVQVRRERERERERVGEVQISTQWDSCILLVCMGCREGQAILIAQPHLYWISGVIPTVKTQPRKWLVEPIWPDIAEIITGNWEGAQLYIILSLFCCSVAMVELRKCLLLLYISTNDIVLIYWNVLFCLYRSMPTVVFVEYTSLTDSTLKMSSQQSSNSTYQYKTR